MRFGLDEENLSLIKSVFEKHPEIREVIIFGSRAKGNYKEGSDIDFALKGKDIDNDLILRIQSELEELNSPYFFDVLDYNSIKDASLKEHIDRVGKLFYRSLED